MTKSRERKINRSITEGKLGTSLWKLALPMMIGGLLQDLFSLVDLFFIGRLGHIAVAALSIAGVILAVIMMAAIGISAGTTALIAHFIGKKDYLSADKVLFQTVVVSFAAALFMIVIGLFGTEGLLRVFGATGEIIPAAVSYLKISFFTSIVIFLFIAFSQALRGSGDAVTPLRILIFANLLNIALDPLFIFGWGIFPRMEVAGSALATAISRALGVGILLWHFTFGHSGLHFSRRVAKINFLLMGRMVKIGFFASFEVLLRQCSFLMLLRLVASFGPACLAAYGIATRLRMAVMMLGFGMATASSILVGQNMGAGQPERATRSGWIALKYYELITLPLALIFFFFSPWIVGLFVADNAEVLAIGGTFLRFIAVTLPFLAAAIILGRSVTGAGDTVAPATFTGIIQLGVRVPLAYALVFFTNLGSSGIWLAVNASDICQGLVLIWYFRTRRWQTRYQKHRAALEGGINQAKESDNS